MSTNFTRRVENLYTDIDYSMVEYVNMTTHVILKCTKHNLEYRQRPCDHYSAKGCNMCAFELKQIPKDIWFNKCKMLYPKNTYDHLVGVEFMQSTELEVNCLEHGMYSVNAGNHFRGKGNCLKCIGRYKRTIDELKADLAIKHQNKYVYNNIPKDWSLNTNIDILCNVCGETFNQNLRCHLISGSGCPSCWKAHNGWSRGSFLKAGEGRICTFYILKCFSESEEFYKLGITSRTIEQRYAQKTTMPYKFQIVNVIQSDALTIWNIEKLFMKHLTPHHYRPQIFFNGSLKECYKF